MKQNPLNLKYLRSNQRSFVCPRNIFFSHSQNVTFVFIWCSTLKYTQKMFMDNLIMKLFIQSWLLFKKLIIQTHHFLNYQNNSYKLKKSLRNYSVLMKINTIFYEFGQNKTENNNILELKHTTFFCTNSRSRSIYTNSIITVIWLGDAVNHRCK